MTAPRTVLGRGVVAGAVGATVLAVWFLITDVRQGEPFRTPAFLASVLGFGDIQMSAVSVLIYTIIHYLAFAVIGIGAAWLADRLDSMPGLPLGIALGFLLFNAVFYGSVWITGIDVVQALGGWPSVLIGNLLAGMAVFATLTAMGVVEPIRWSETLSEHYTVREGLITGLLGAAAVAAWFLIVDAVSGQLFFTPAALGSAAFLGARAADAVEVSVFTVVGYTVVHVIAFVLTGLAAAAVVAAAEEHSEAILLGGVLLFVTLEAFSIGLLTIAAEWLVDTLSWWNIGGANLVAALCMGGYLYMRHPNLLRDVRERDLEEDLAQDVPGPGHIEVHR